MKYIFFLTALVFLLSSCANEKDRYALIDVEYSNGDRDTMWYYVSSDAARIRIKTSEPGFLSDAPIPACLDIYNGFVKPQVCGVRRFKVLKESQYKN